MVITSLKKQARPVLLALACSLAASALSPTPVGAAYAVIDAKNLAEAKKRISELKKQLEELKAMKDQLQRQLNAIGEMGKISIPSLNLPKIGRQLQRDMQCLMPDLEQLFPAIELDELEFGSVCGAGDAYRRYLWIHPEEAARMPATEQTRRYRQIQERRENVLTDAASKGLAHGDIALKGAVDLNNAADEIAAASEAAESQNDRLAVLTKSQALLIRSQASTNQLLAQLLKITAAHALIIGVDVKNILSEPPEETTDRIEGGKK